MNFFLNGIKDKTLVVLIFFVFLSASLFVGDGKQKFIEGYLGLGILITYFVAYVNKIKIIMLPRAVFVLWFLIILYFFVRAPLSDSIGYSISSTVRMIEAFLVYTLFYSLSDQKALNNFCTGLKALCVLAVTVSVVLIIFPWMTRYLPTMNLLYSTYGHNHLVDILLFVFPLALFEVSKNKGASSKMFLTIVLLGIAVSFSRGALLLVGGFVVFYLFKNKRYRWLWTATLVLTIMAAGWLVLDQTLVSQKPTNGPWAPNLFWLRRQIVKAPLWQDPRLEYWRQASIAILERPWFGGGPGTFYLDSLRLERSRSSYSWFAHSFPLETVVEVGLVGAALIVLLVLQIFRAVAVSFKKENHNTAARVLFGGLLLTLFYSLFEYNLSFLIVWISFWSILGLLSGQVFKDARIQTGFQGKTSSVLLLALLLFCSLFFAGLLLGHKNHVLGFYLSPFQEERAADLLQKSIKSKEGLSNTQLFLVSFFFKKDPEILYWRAKYYQDKDVVLARKLFREAAAKDGFNFLYYNQMLGYEIDFGNTRDIADAAKFVFPLYFPALSKELPNLPSLPEVSPDPAIKRIYNTVSYEPDYPEFLSKLYYFLGLSVLSGSPQTTQAYWNLALKTNPNIGFFYAEIASLRKHKFKDYSGAIKIINDCMKNYYSALHCRQLSSLDTLPPPGYIAQDIENKKRPVK